MKTRATNLLAAATVVVVLAAGGMVRGADQITIRGEYYREPSTRVIQPVVEISKDLPQGFDVETHYLLDAITSASQAAGVTTDSTFTELRNEVGLGIGKSWERTRATLAYKYSSESDYWSNAFSGSVAQRLWADTATVALSYGASFDSMSSRGRTPLCAPAPSIYCSLDTYFGGLSYTQILSPVSIAQVDVESAYLTGFLGNLYRQVPMLGYERPPTRRLRNAVAVRFAFYSPETAAGFQIHYRFYWDEYPGTPATTYDPWGMQAHTIEARIYKKLSRTLELRLLYRQHFQSRAEFWCDVTLNPGCYDVSATAAVPYYSSDPKLGPVHTEYPEVKLIWDADPLRDVPFFRWFAAGTFEISYGRYFQNDSFGDAHVLQMGYTMPY